MVCVHWGRVVWFLLRKDNFSGQSSTFYPVAHTGLGTLRMVVVEGGGGGGEGLIYPQIFLLKNGFLTSYLFGNHVVTTKFLLYRNQKVINFTT